MTSLISLLLGIDCIPVTFLIGLGIWQSQELSPGGSWWQVALQQRVFHFCPSERRYE